ncbi:response regulator [Streptomyces sp. x-19]|uniref:response regulator n=1 Tax=Streptomyces sp. x-19 TaxID=2789280 RepID=UPI00397F50C4
MLRILIADDEPFVRHGLRTILEADPGIRVAAEAADGLTAVAEARAHPCDVALVDIRMPRMDGLAATHALLALPTAPAVIILTTFQLDEYVTEALRAGASGFLLKDTLPTDIIKAVYTVAEGNALLSPAVTRHAINMLLQRHRGLTPEERARIASLTKREHQVLLQLAEGLSNANIAQTLFTSESTVKMHVSRILAKLHVDNRVQAALLAREAHLTRQ